uniref:Uncharacterized protein n=1 Tax=Biomphalaria glabrata TaxID=6526 RepID=A0A2C9L090_BIOGL
MNIFLLSLVLVAAASANVIREEEDNCFPIAGVNLCGDLPISGKRDEKDKRILPCYYIDGVRTCIGIKKEEDLNLAEIVADIGNVVQVIGSFIGGAATKREEQDLDACITFGCTKICPNSDTNMIINVCKRDEQEVDVATCFTINGVRTCLPFLRREEDLNLAEIVANIGKVVQVIDGFISGAAAKREEQDVSVCVTLGCTRVCPDMAMTNVCKREEQDISIPFCYTLDGVKTCIPNIKREEESLNLADIVANIGKVIHVIDGFVSGATA